MGKLTTLERLASAKALVGTPEKWAQGPGSWGSGRHCSQQALLDAELGWYQDEFARALPFKYRLRAWFGGYWSCLSSANIIRFNDHSSTTHADVVALFDRSLGRAALAAATGGGK
jgi:hypothetical protein